MDEDKKSKKEQAKEEIIIVPKNVALNQDFFDAMMKFQYGSAEESDMGFEKMNQLLSESRKKSEKKEGE